MVSAVASVGRADAQRGGELVGVDRVGAELVEHPAQQRVRLEEPARRPGRPSAGAAPDAEGAAQARGRLEEVGDARGTDARRRG